MNDDLRKLAERQFDVVAAWQLRAAGWSERAIKHRVREHGWRAVHRGVYALNSSPLTRDQLWMAATLTSPNTYLSGPSAGACWGLRHWSGTVEFVVRPGNGGPKRFGGVIVRRSRTLDGETTARNGIPILTAARVLIDLTPHQAEKATRRCFREALRLRVMTRRDLERALERRGGKPELLHELVTRYGHLPYQRTRSDPEGRALELITDSGRPQPLVNVKIAGEEADLVWLKDKRILEIDGPQYHRFPEEDARKQATWEKAGFTVDRLPSGSVYRR